MSTICNECGTEIEIGQFPWCHGDPTRHQLSKQGAIGDECDVLIKHGLCHDDGSPRRFTSKSEIARAAKAAGKTPYVVHQPPPGTDKSKFTQRWI